MVLSYKALKQLLWESLTDKFCQYLKELTKALHFFYLLLMVSYVQGTLRKELLIVSFVEHFKTTKYFRKASLIPFIDTLNKILKHCLFADFLLIVSYGQGVLQKEQRAVF